MLRKNHTTILNAILALGIIFYLIFVFNYNLPMGIITLILFLYMWIIGKMYFKTFETDSFFRLVSFVGVLLSFSSFFLYGVEEVPYPEGAIIFHSEGIALSFILFFVSTMFFLYKPPKKAEKNVVHSENIAAENIKKEKWEEATIEDLQSGKFETI